MKTDKGLAIIESLCGMDENYNPPAVMKWTGPVATAGVHTDPQIAYQSQMRIKNMADIIIPMHEARMLWTDRIP